MAEEAGGGVAPEVHLASTLLRLQLVRYGWGVGVGDCGGRGWGGGVEGGGGEEAGGRVAPEVHLASRLLSLELVRDGWGGGGEDGVYVYVYVCVCGGGGGGRRGER